MIKQSPLVIALFLGSASAFRPVSKVSAPWYKEASKSTWEQPDWPINYTVPHFGQDSDIKDTIRHTAYAENQVGHKMEASFKKPKGHPVDYFVPNFGVDHDVKLTQDHTKEAEKSLQHKWTPEQDQNGVWMVPSEKHNNWTFLQFDDVNQLQLEAGSDPICSSAGCDKSKFKKASTHPMDYFVPNFGRDGDMMNTDNSLAAAEGITGHVWNWAETKKKVAADPVIYPNDPLDEDVIDTMGHVEQQEALHGKWVPVQDDNGVWMLPSAYDNGSYTYASGEPTDMAVQLDSESEVKREPLLSWSPKVAHDSVPKNYPVPNFGQDPEAHEWVSDSIAAAELIHGRKIKWTKPNKAEEHPINYKVANFGQDQEMKQTWEHLGEAEQQLGHKWVISKKKAAEHPMNYHVANFGRDHDMVANDGSLSTAEQITGHKWIYDPSKKKAAEHPVDYAVANFGLDHDIADTQSHIAQQEKVHGKFNVRQDDNGVWMVPTAADNASYTYGK